MDKQIIYIPTWTEYKRIYTDYYRNKREMFNYFSKWNKWFIDSVDLEEEKIFIASDYYYIRKMNENTCLK